jgi:hypothetical protein
MFVLDTGYDNCRVKMPSPCIQYENSQYFYEPNGKCRRRGVVMNRTPCV